MGDSRQYFRTNLVLLIKLTVDKMRSINVIFIPLALWVYTVAGDEKLAKHFSLFSVVTFGNEECTSSSSVAGGATEGTCYSSTECSDKNGMSAGNCASGFGVCCVFLNTGAATASTICQDGLVLATTDNSALTSSPSGTLCGQLTGEHIYIDLSPTSSDALTATLTTAVSTTITPAVAQRVWDVKVSQIECHATYRAPPGCQRYMMEESGKIISYNFGVVTGATRAANGQNAGVELTLQNIKTCIRRAKHMCCVEYALCSTYNGIALADTVSTTVVADMGVTGIYSQAWMMDFDTQPFLITASQVNQGLVDSQCTTDYVEIPSSMSRTCGGMFGSHLGTMNTRYCGSKFGANGQAAIATSSGTAVCDCSEPWSLTIRTDDRNDSGAAATDNPGASSVTIPQGVCIDYKQTPCYH